MLMKMFFKILTWRNSWKALRRLAMLTWTVKVFKTAAQDQTRLEKYSWPEHKQMDETIYSFRWPLMISVPIGWIVISGLGLIDKSMV